MLGATYHHGVTMKRPPFILFTLFLVVAGVAGAFLLHCPAGEPTQCNFNRIELGTSRAEVEALMGPGEKMSNGHAGKRLAGSLIKPASSPAVLGDDACGWGLQAGHATYIVSFRQGSVVGKWCWRTGFPYSWDSGKASSKR
jgi:hypothetical protein